MSVPLAGSSHDTTVHYDLIYHTYGLADIWASFILNDGYHSGMSTTALTHEQNSTEIPAEIESANSKLVYLYLHTAGEATVEELQSSLGMKQLALFPVLDTLSGEGLVAREGERYTVAA